MSEQEGDAKYRELRLTINLFTRSKVVLVSIAIIVFFYIMAVDPSLFASGNPDIVHLNQILLQPSAEHIFGTDQVGRDVLTRVIWGSQFSMAIGILVVTLQVAIGVPLGAVAAYAGGAVDNIIMRLTDMFLAFPGIIFALVLSFILGRGFDAVVIALGLVFWTSTARVVRGSILVEKEKEYVTAAKALGMSHFRILFSEILPNCIQPVIVLATLSLGDAIVSAAGLSFIGVGIQPPTPDWGNLISTGTQYMLVRPWMSIIPGVCIIAVVLSFNLIGDVYRDALDPKLRREMKK